MRARDRVSLAVVSGIALILNVLSLLVAQQREQFAVLKTAGVSGLLLAVSTLTQGLVVGLIGGVVGVLASVPATQGVNRVVPDITGFPELIEIPPWLLATSIVLAIVMGILGSTVAGWRVSRLSPMAHLRR